MPEALQIVDDDSKELANQFVQRYTRLQLQKKTIGKDVKALRQEFEEQGLPTGDVLKAFNKMRSEKRAGDEKLEQIETFKQWLQENTETQDLVTELDAKI